MKIISKHPIFYEIYKNIRFKVGFHTGTVCGYYISKKSGDTLLWAETEFENRDSFTREFIEKEDIELKDYQGNFDKIFFLVTKKNIKDGLVQIIE